MISETPVGRDATPDAGEDARTTLNPNVLKNLRLLIRNSEAGE
jgi:hypothetical protein